jgi:hypothetical protein
MKLNAVPLGVALGAVLGVGVFLLTLVVMSQGGGAHLHLLRRVCPGFSTGVGGAFLGLVYWFIYGFVGGAVLAVVYNRVGKLR